MKKIITLVALLSFAVGLNAAITKEDIYNSNPAQFDSLKKELVNIQVQQTEQQRKVFEKQQVANAIKTVFSNKELLKNASYAVVKNGQIIKTGNSRNEDGLLLWHEHSANLQDTPPANTCRIYAPTWESLTFDNPCGNIKYQLEATSIYANMQVAPLLWVFPEGDDVNSWINQHIQNNITSDSSFLENDSLLQVPVINSQSVINTWLSHQVVTDTFNHSGYVFVNEYGGRILNKPYGLSPFLAVDINLENAYFMPTEYSYQGNDIITLKSGNYIQLLDFVYPVNNNDWSEGFYIVLRWVNIRVENYYLNDVSVQKPSKDDVEITFNNSNKEISINLKDSLNLEDKNYELYDISGKLMMKGKIASHHTIVSMPAVASGVYLVRVNGKDINATRKISFVK